MGSQKLKETIKGGGWDHNNKCNATSNIFYKWLTDKPFIRMKGLIARGFPEDASKLTSQTADNVATEIKDILKHNTPGELQKALSYLLFSCPWHDSLLGHALCFLYTFCSKVSAEDGSLKEKLKGYSEELTDVCQKLQRKLEPFVKGSSGLPLSAVCQSNTTLYSQLWDDEHFDAYVKWLKENLKDIIGALQEMSSEPPGWSLSTIPHGFSAGPFKYGFVFKDDSWKDGTFKSGLSTSDLEESLRSLNECLGNISSGNSGSSGVTAGGAAGGVLGAGGLGFGAAYATNAFGLKDIISGLIASLIK
ncbi:hypothetical protein X943_003621 [Babesia divergens]|uniref:Uncharacterized protein n=1 Tax=Babesia divergens TaxID=32595 RepID=A0AAD9GEE3_BABDI|nr:hypothetical protein X943_003621 [Babesia divergens]